MESLLLFLGIIISIFTYIPLIFIFWFAGVQIRFRNRHFIVDTFRNDDCEFEGTIKKSKNEKVLEHAFSSRTFNKFYLSNSRFVFFSKNVFNTYSLTKYLPIQSIKNVSLIYKNPYGYLITAGVIFITGIILGAAGSETKTVLGQKSSLSSVPIIVCTLISAAFVWIWYYINGYYLTFEDNHPHGIFSKSSEGVTNLLREFDNLRFGSGKAVDYTSSVPVQLQQDVSCKNCHSIITLEEDDLKNEIFVCPICNTENVIQISGIVK